MFELKVAQIITTNNLPKVTLSVILEIETHKVCCKHQVSLINLNFEIL